MRVSIVLIGMLLLVGEDASAQELTRSRELAAHCRTKDEYCKGYIDGYVDAAELYQLWNTMTGARFQQDAPSFCPASVGVDGFAEAYVAYIDKNPGKAGMSAGSTFIDMLTTNYRCPIQRPPNWRPAH